MLVDALFDPLSIAVLAIVLGMIAVSMSWHAQGSAKLEELRGGLKVLRNVGRQLAPDHPIRKRLEAAPVVDLSFEEIARLMAGDRVEPTARTLVELEVAGGLPDSVVRRALERVLPALQSCAAQVGTRVVTVRFAIEETRRAAAVKIGGVGGACVAAELANVRTDVAPDIGDVNVEVRIAFGI